MGESLQDADLSWAELWGASLARANLQAAQLTGAELHKTSFVDTDLRGSFITWVDLSGATLRSVKIDCNTRFDGTDIRGTAFQNVDLSDIPQIYSNLDSIYSDDSTILPPEIPRPDHWPKETLEWRDFETKWRAWAKTKGFDIPE